MIAASFMFSVFAAQAFFHSFHITIVTPEPFLASNSEVLVSVSTAEKVFWFLPFGVISYNSTTSFLTLPLFSQYRCPHIEKWVYSLILILSMSLSMQNDSDSLTNS